MGGRREFMQQVNSRKQNGLAVLKTSKFEILALYFQMEVV